MTNPTESLVARLKSAGQLIKRIEMKGGVSPIASVEALSRAEQAIHEAAERLPTLEAALRPFAECIDRLAPGDDIAHWRLTDALDHGLTVEHVIRARTALSNEAGK